MANKEPKKCLDCGYPIATDIGYKEHHFRICNRCKMPWSAVDLEIMFKIEKKYGKSIYKETKLESIKDYFND